MPSAAEARQHRKSVVIVPRLLQYHTIQLSRQPRAITRGLSQIASFFYGRQQAPLLLDKIPAKIIDVPDRVHSYHPVRFPFRWPRLAILDIFTATRCRCVCRGHTIVLKCASNASAVERPTEKRGVKKRGKTQLAYGLQRKNISTPNDIASKPTRTVSAFYPTTLHWQSRGGSRYW